MENEVNELQLYIKKKMNDKYVLSKHEAFFHLIWVVSVCLRKQWKMIMIKCLQSFFYCPFFIGFLSTICSIQPFLNTRLFFFNHTSIVYSGNFIVFVFMIIIIMLSVLLTILY